MYVKEISDSTTLAFALRWRIGFRCCNGKRAPLIRANAVRSIPVEFSPSIASKFLAVSVAQEGLACKCWPYVRESEL